MDRTTTPLSERMRCIDWLLLDVDGVLTDGRIIYADNGVEVKQFHVRDGSGLKLWQRAGKRAAIITGRSSTIVEVRAAELGVAPVIQGAADKMAALRQLLSQIAVGPERLAAIGDDLPDWPLLRHCGVGIAVADACPELRIEADFVTEAAGGRGAVREAIERILSAQGLWHRLIEEYRSERLG